MATKKKKEANQEDAVAAGTRPALPSLLRQRVERHLGKALKYVYRVDDSNINVLGVVDQAGAVSYFDLRNNKAVAASALKSTIEDTATEPRAGTSGQDIGTGATTSGGNYEMGVTRETTEGEDTATAAPKKRTARKSTSKKK